MTEVETMLAEREIVNAVVGYTDALDARDWEAFQALFADQVIMESNLRDTPPVPLDIDALLARVQGQSTAFVMTLHYVSNFRVQIDGDEASCRSYLYAQHVISEDPAAPRFVAHGTYIHRLRRTSDGWRICGIATNFQIRDGVLPPPRKIASA